MKKKIGLIILLLLIIVIIAVVIGVVFLAVGVVPFSIEDSLKSIKQNSNYAYTATEISALHPSRVIYVEREKKRLSIDTGVNEFVVDYGIGGENCGVYTRLNNVWYYEEMLTGEEGNGLAEDNRALIAFDLAVADLEGNYQYNKKEKKYEIKKESYNLIFVNSVGGTCEIYKSKGKIYIDVMHGIEGNNHEIIMITQVGGVKINMPKIVDLV